MAYDWLLLGGEVASSQEVVRADVAIRGEQIVAVGDLKGHPAERTLHCDGLTILPGLIDSQVHFREPGFEHKEDLESGSRSAVMGGVTTVLEMPNTNPPTTTAEALQDKLARAHARMWCDHGFFVGATAENADHLAELELLPGTPGIKIFMGSSTGTLLVDAEQDLRRVLRSGKRPCAVHAEDESRNRLRKAEFANPTVADHPIIRDAISAEIATRRMIALSKETRRPVHILHVSTANELEPIARAKRNGIPITAEVTPQHLFFAAPECYARLGTLAQMNPPIRDESHRSALRKALREGLFDVFGSDHAPHTLEEKARPYPQSPSGMPGVQTLLPVLTTLISQGLLTTKQLVQMAAERPASLYGIINKGHIKPGFDADLAMVDLGRKVRFTRDMVESKCGWSPYEGEELTGWPVHVFVRGHAAMLEGHLAGEPQGRPARYDWK